MLKKANMLAHATVLVVVTVTQIRLEATRKVRVGLLTMRVNSLVSVMMACPRRTRSVSIVRAQSMSTTVSLLKNLRQTRQYHQRPVT